MNTINPVLTSSSATAQMQSSSAPQSEARRMTDQPAGSTTSAGNSTVTLSDQAQRLSQSDLNLQATQTVQDTESAANRTVEQNQLDNRLTYSASLQGQNQYSQSANELVEPNS